MANVLNVCCLLEIQRSNIALSLNDAHLNLWPLSFDAWNFFAIRFHLKRPDEGEGTTEKYGIIDILFVALAKKYCLNKLQITDNIWWYPELRSFQLVAIATTITAFVNR